MHLKEGLSSVEKNFVFFNSSEWLLICDMCYFTLCCPFCQMRRMTQLLKAIYGEKLYKSKNHPDWVKLAEKPSYPIVPVQGANECGIYVLRMTQLYDGQRLVEKILKSDVTASLFSFHFFVLYDDLFF